MQAPDYWNHNAYVVAPQNLPLIEECFDQLFPWGKKRFEGRTTGVSYRLHPDGRLGVLFLEASPWADLLNKAIGHLREKSPELAEAFRLREATSPNSVDHNGFRVGSVAEWERRVKGVQRLEKERPDFQLKVTVIRKSGPAPAPSGELYQVYQCFIRIGLLGPLRNTLEMSCIVPDKHP